MEKIKVITDSSAYISRELVEENNIGVVPMTYIVNGEENKEGFPGDFHEFFREMEEGKLEVTTSQPAIGDFIEEYEKSFEAGYDKLIVIVMSSKISGTYNSALMAKESLNNENIVVIDSLTSAGNMKELVFDALTMIDEGKKLDEIEAFIDEKKIDARVYIVADNLKYLEKSGRISKAKMLVGNMLNVKPIIEMKDGEMKLATKARGKKQAFNKIMDLIPENVRKISISPVYAQEDARKLYDTMVERFPKARISIEEIGVVVGAHVGPNSMGICVI